MRSPSFHSRSAVVGLLVITAVLMVHVRYIGTPGNDWRMAINGDGKGYYEYLRMFLFPGDAASHPGKGALHPTIDSPVIKHFSGGAVAMAPFVLAAHTYTLFNRGKPEDGYSLHYQIAVGLAALCWLALGLFALRRFLLDLGVEDAVVAITLLLLVLGTGLIVQAVVHPSMSHVYGFAAVALILQRTQVLLRSPSAQRLLLVAALIGFSALIRPVDLLVLIALPLSAVNIRVDRAALRSLLLSGSGALALLVFLVVVSLQGLLWYLQSGSFLVRSYPGEGFHWDRPEMLNSLFSARNGLLFYWPLLALVVPGTWLLWRKTHRAAITFICFIIPFVYVTSTWWNWAYGDNFGQRTYLDMLPVFAVPFAAAIPSGRSLRWALIVGGLCLCALNLFQGWQYKNHLLVTGQMDPIRYRYIFLETDPEHVRRVGGFAELPLYAPDGYADVPVEWITTKDLANGRRDTALYDLLAAPIPWSTIGQPIYVQADLTRFEGVPGASRDAWIRLVLRRNGEERGMLRFRMNLVPGASPAARTWHYAFNMRQHEEGDTLVIKASGGAGFGISRIEASLSMPR